MKYRRIDYSKISSWNNGEEVIELKTKMLVLVLIAILGLSIGYSALNTDLSISGDADVIVKSDIAHNKILNDNGGVEYIENKGTPDFSQIATTDEGMYATLDNDGTSYYFRGAVENNWLYFAGYYWRIIRINGDGSIRVIYNGTTTNQTGSDTQIGTNPFTHGTGSSYYVGYTYVEGLQRPTELNAGTDSAMKEYLDNWYLQNLNLKSSYIVQDAKYCNDRTIKEGDTWVVNGKTVDYAANIRLKQYSPTLICSNYLDNYELNIGLITADEVSMAGGIDGAESTYYYLRTGYAYYTMSPYNFYIGNNFCGIYVVNSVGRLNTVSAQGSQRVRPVINLKSDIMLSGDGTVNNPYRIVD